METQKVAEVKPESQPDHVSAARDAGVPVAGGIGSLLSLQGIIGNRAAGRFLQAKLTVSEPTDEYEQEADRVADQVMRMADPDADDIGDIQENSSPTLQRACTKCEEEDEKHTGADVNISRMALPNLQRACAECEAEEDEEQTGADVNVSRMALPDLQRACAKCEDEEEKHNLHRTASTNASSFSASKPTAEQQVENARGGGQPRW